MMDLYTILQRIYTNNTIDILTNRATNKRIIYLCAPSIRHDFDNTKMSAEKS